MAGHSQFANIKHRKSAQDAKKSKLFTKLRREIIVAARNGLPEIDKNPRLKSAVINAKREGLPKDRIDAAIKSAKGGLLHDNYENITYEGYACGGVALIVDALTDNRNRTASNLRALLSKFDGSLAESGSVAFMFDRVGKLSFSTVKDTESFFDCAIALGVDDIIEDQHRFHLVCKRDLLFSILTQLSNKFGEPEFSSLVWQPKTGIDLSKSQSEELLKLINLLEDIEDVHNVFTNATKITKSDKNNS